jgi:Protein of unknown function (DUF2577).
MIETIKKAAVDAVENGKPTGIYYGTVEAVSPLTIKIDQKTQLEEPQLILTSLLRDFDVDMTVEHETEDYVSDTIHRHGYKGIKKFTVHLGLKEGERVMLLRIQGGQKYIVLDRMVDNDSENQ